MNMCQLGLKVVTCLQSHMAKLYSERLSQMIQFDWQEGNRRKQGVITLKGVRLPTSCISLMRPVPLQFGESYLSEYTENVFLSC